MGLQAGFTLPVTGQLAAPVPPARSSSLPGLSFSGAAVVGTMAFAALRCRTATTGRRPARRFATAVTATAVTEPPRGSARQRVAFKPGDELVNGAFQVTSVDPIAAYNVTCIELLHKKTGARWLHVDCDDSNNVFNVAFRTTPVNSTGVAHILEHTALCGSERYPVRDPFFNMLKRSLSTFMNAMTAPDYTMYPFSTMNAVDYFNLLQVYLDAAFFPKLTKDDFLQEGHRLEFKDPSDPDSGVQIKGVVYNEMKGAMGSSAARFGRALSSKLFPTSTYHHNSGGDPVNIPELTWEDLRSFHANSYHPSNARFYTYGDLPLEETLAKAQELALGRFEARDVSALDVANEVRYTEPVRLETTVPEDAVVTDPTKQTTVSTAWLLVNQIEESDSLDSFALSVASNLLLDGPQAVFYEALIEPGWGTGFAPGTGYGGSRRETSFAVGLKGIAAEDVAKVEERILETMERLARDGLPRDRIDTLLHQVELGTATVSTRFGLNVGMGVMSLFVHGGDALRPLRVTEKAAQLVEKLDADPNFWQDLFRRRFVENAHRVTVVANPDKEYDAKLESEEAEKMMQKSAALSEGEKKIIAAEAEALKAAQEAATDPEVLPTLTVAEAVPKLAQTYSSEHCQVAGVPTQYDFQPTNGITYISAVFDISKLPDRLVPYLPLFTRFLDELGTKQRDFKELAEAMKGSTGGISAGVGATPSLADPDDCKLELSISSHALDRNVSTMFDLLEEVILGASWTGQDARLQMLLKRRAAAAGASISSGGLGYAQSRATSLLRAEAALDERMGGLPHVAELQRLVRQDAIDEVSSALVEIASHVFSSSAVSRCRLVAQKEAMPNAEKQLARFLEAMPSQKEAAGTGPSLGEVVSNFSSPEAERAFVAVPTQTNYCALALRTVPYAHPDAAPLYLLGQAMSTCFLHKEIREKGGAYGGGSSAIPTSGTFMFTSYRDPNSTATLDRFEEAIKWAATEGSLSARDVEEAHLRAFKNLDAPRAPSARGASLFSAGLDDASRQLFRDRLLACTAETLREVAERHLLGNNNSAAAIVGNASAVPVTHGVDGWTVLGPDGRPLVPA
mmetsp:Transcript_21812/g.39127  ORF Transcript_21812/g.39127 Transcript_21812/m.39127 type:complete len:1079 (+) Transcript_21812:24-3260(+)